jgi:hypothetical protein
VRISATAVHGRGYADGGRALGVKRRKKRDKHECLDSTRIKVTFLTKGTKTRWRGRSIKGMGPRVEGQFGLEFQRDRSNRRRFGISIVGG